MIMTIIINWDSVIGYQWYLTIIIIAINTFQVISHTLNSQQYVYNISIKQLHIHIKKCSMVIVLSNLSYWTSYMCICMTDGQYSKYI